MSEAQRKARKAKNELEVTKEAFNTLHNDLVEATLDATDAESAYKGVLAVQALRQVRMRMSAAVDAALIEEKAEEYAE